MRNSFQRMLCFFPVQAELRIGDGRLPPLKHCGVPGDHVFIVQGPDGNVARRVARCGDDFTTVTPIKTVAVAEQESHRNRVEVSVSFAKLLAKGSLLLRKLRLQGFPLLQPERNR